MKNELVSTVVALAIACFPTAVAQTQTAENLAACMVSNSGESEEEAMKTMMIRALQDAPREELQGITIQLGMSMVTLATVKCGMGMSELESPVFEAAAEIYGMQMGEKIMNKALAKIG